MDATAERASSRSVKRAFFLDTSAWVAAAMPGQARHAEAKAAYAAALRGGNRILTTPMVLGEAHALFLRYLGGRLAQLAVESVLADPSHTIVPVDEELVQAALKSWVARFGDQGFSLCDAVSFETMKREGLTRALTIDHHFAVAGFETIA